MQSRAAEECKTSINADGFGVAWYHARPEPGLYRDVFPAWSDPNLKALCAQVKSHAFIAHVRASTGTAISRNNCHPFTFGRYSFVHNGQVGGYDSFRKTADMMIEESYYPHRKGATDSEALFLIALGEGLEADPVGQWAAPWHDLKHWRAGVVYCRLCDFQRRFVMASGSMLFDMLLMRTLQRSTIAGVRAEKAGRLYRNLWLMGKGDGVRKRQELLRSLKARKCSLNALHLSALRPRFYERTQ